MSSERRAANGGLTAGAQPAHSKPRSPPRRHIRPRQTAARKLPRASPPSRLTVAAFQPPSAWALNLRRHMVLSSHRAWTRDFRTDLVRLPDRVPAFPLEAEPSALPWFLTTRTSSRSGRVVRNPKPQAKETGAPPQTRTTERERGHTQPQDHYRPTEASMEILLCGIQTALTTPHRRNAGRVRSSP
jgi:hypothetical protein